MADDIRRFLRHVLATIAYRGGKTLRGAPDGFADARIQADTRSAVEIVAHLADLMEWALTSVEGQAKWNPQPPAAWQHEVDRFFAALERLDTFLAGGAPIGCPPERLFQGPLADALTHVGQLSTLRRAAGVPVRSENFYQAPIEVGSVGPEQKPPKFEFD